MSGIVQPQITKSRGALARYLRWSDQLVHLSFFASTCRTTKRATSSSNGDECK